MKNISTFEIDFIFRESFLGKVGNPCLESINAVGLEVFVSADNHEIAVSEVSQGLQVSRLG